MADLEYSVGVNSKDAQNGLKKLQSTVKETTDVFGRLKTAVAGLAVGATIKGALEMANVMRDLSNATGIALQNLVGFTNAMAANGSTIDRARDGLTDFVKNVGEAAAGSSELQKSFARAGVSLNDLATLSEQDLLRKTIQGLSNIGSGAQQSAIAMRIFGESFKGVDIDGLNRDLDAAIRNSAEYASAIDAAGAANQGIKNAFVVLQNEILKSLEPLSKFAAEMLSNTETIKRVIGGILDLVETLGLLYIATKAAKWVEGLLYTLKLLRTAGIAGLLTDFPKLAGAMGGVTTSLTQLRGGFATMLTSLKALDFAGAGAGLRVFAGGFARFIPVIGQVVLAFQALDIAVTAFTGNDISGWFKTATVEMRKFFGATQEEITKLEAWAKSDVGIWETIWAAITGKEINLTADGERMEDYFKRLYAKQREESDKAAAAEEENQRRIREVINQQKIELDKIVDAYREKSEASLESLNIERQLLGYRDEEVDYQRTILEYNKQYQEQVKALQDKIRELNKLPGEHAEEVAAIQAALAEVTAEYQAQLPFIEDAARLIAEEAKAARIAQEAAEKLKEEMEKVADAAKSTSQFIKDLQQSSADAAFELESLNMNPLQKQIAEIERDIKSKVNVRIEELKALMATIDDPAQKDALRKQIADISEAARQAIDTQQQLARKSYQYQRTFSYGWAQAFREYADNATNAAKKAGEIFNKTTQGIEDLLVNFVKTGKFEWKNFVADMLETLLRSQIQQTIAKVFDVTGLGGGQGGGGILDSILGFFGAGSSSAQKGQNASAPLYVYDVSGGMGGGTLGGFGGTPAATGGGFFENIGSTISNFISNPIKSITSGISSVVGGISNTIGSVVNSVGSFFGGSSNPSSGGGFFSGIADTVGSVVSGIGDFFGGFFANGGSLPKGKFGIVGERGPELISGPANITPLGGLGGSVTYNINAVDAASFKALVARDPGFIHAVAMKGASGIPGRR